MIAGKPYVLVDMGVEGRLPATSRHGVQGLYGRSVATDPRLLTSYVRDISLVGAAQYASLHPPLALRTFPADLENPGLEYAGMYEDGWIAEDSWVRLAGGPPTELVVNGEIPAGAGRRIRVTVNGRQLTVGAAAPGRLALRVSVPASRTSRRIELQFAATIKLHAPDLRPAAAHLTFLGLSR
jgi:hypothetical protein